MIIRAFILSLWVAFSSFATFTEFYVQTTGSNLNAGSTTSDTAAFTYASGTWVAGTGVFTVASGNPSTDGVTAGMFASVYADGAAVTGFVGRITGVTSTTITVSLTAKSGTAPTDGTSNRTLRVGGAWAGPSGTSGFPFGFVQSTMTDSSSNPTRVNIKGGTTYNITAQITHNQSGPIYFEGYTTTVGDGGRATIDGGTSGVEYSLLIVSSSDNSISGLIFQNNGSSSSGNPALFITGNENHVYRCVVNNVRSHGIAVSGADCMIEACEVYSANKSNGGGQGAFYNSSNPSTFIRCIAHDNTGSNASGFVALVSGQYLYCISDSNGQRGFQINSTAGCLLIGCDAYNNTTDGVDLLGGSAAFILIENCNFVKNGGWGINSSGSSVRIGAIRNCGFGSGTQANTSGSISSAANQLIETGTVTYSSNTTPWVDPANGDFRISDSLAKGSGLGTFTQTASSYSGTVGYPDIGAAQHQDAGGGSSQHAYAFSE